MFESTNIYSAREFELIEYPGLVQNIDQMLITLGGLPNLSQTFSGKQKRLELRFHPKNPFNKACYGDNTSRAGLLLLIKSRRSKRNPQNKSKLSIKIIGYNKRIFTFDSLGDFQFLPLYRNISSDNNKSTYTVNALTHIVPHSPTETEYFSSTNSPVICLPQIFARCDVVHSGILRCEIQEDGQQDVLGVLQKSSYDNRDMVAFNLIDNFPMHPDPQTLKRMRVKYVSDEQFECIKSLFAKCPIWTKIALLHESGITSEKLRCIIPCIAYYFTSGPWRTLYARYGYDPRKDFRSRYYQTFDFRLRFLFGVSEFVNKRQQSIKGKHESPSVSDSLVQNIDYPYLEENKLPRARQCILRYMDVRIAEVQNEIKLLQAGKAVCNEKTGWLPYGFDSKIRAIVSKSLRELLKNHYRKEHIHAELDSVDNNQTGYEDEDAGEEDYNIELVTNEFLPENIDDILDVPCYDASP